MDIVLWLVISRVGIPMRDLAKKLAMSGPGAGYAVERGEHIAKQNSYSLSD